MLRTQVMTAHAYDTYCQFHGINNKQLTINNNNNNNNKQ